MSAGASAATPDLDPVLRAYLTRFRISLTHPPKWVDPVARERFAAALSSFDPRTVDGRALKVFFYPARDAYYDARDAPGGNDLKAYEAGWNALVAAINGTAAAPAESPPPTTQARSEPEPAQPPVAAPARPQAPVVELPSRSPAAYAPPADPARGFVKLNRALRDSEIKRDPGLLAIWVEMLLAAAWRPTKLDDGTRLGPGQLVASLKSLAAATGLTIKEVRPRLARLEERGSITRMVRARKESILTIVNWRSYQSDPGDEGTKPDTRQGTKPNGTNPSADAGFTDSTPDEGHETTPQGHETAPKQGTKPNGVKPSNGAGFQGSPGQEGHEKEADQGTPFLRTSGKNPELGGRATRASARPAHSLDSAERLTIKLARFVAETSPDAEIPLVDSPGWQGWVEEVDRLLRLGRPGGSKPVDPGAVEAVIDWAWKGDDDFWRQGQVLNPAGLRKNWPRLSAQCLADTAKKAKAEAAEKTKRERTRKREAKLEQLSPAGRERSAEEARKAAEMAKTGFKDPKKHDGGSHEGLKNAEAEASKPTGDPNG